MVHRVKKAHSYFLRARAAALLIVLWAIALLSFLIITSMAVMQRSSEIGYSQKTVLMARNLAEKGVALGVHPEVKAGDPVLTQEFPEGTGFQVILGKEEGRLNLNSWLTEDRLPFLKHLLVQQWGMNTVEAEALMDAWMDWTDADEYKRLKGAEKREYEDAGLNQRPSNRPFRDLDEIRAVMGMDQFEGIRPDWREHFTVLTRGQLDVNEAGAELLAGVTRASLAQAQLLVDHRKGPDGVWQTEDDTPFESVDEALAFLGIGENDAELLKSALTTKGDMRRVISIGWVAGYALGISVVFERSGNEIRLLEWREFRPDEVTGMEINRRIYSRGTL